jgi:hypothetical protein
LFAEERTLKGFVMDHPGAARRVTAWKAAKTDFAVLLRSKSKR